MVRSKIMYRKKEDRISELPECLLLEIISRLELSTKKVIKTTTTISKRWQHLWTRLPTLVFTYEDNVNKALNQCPTDVNLKKFKLQIVNGHTLFNRWIRYAIMRNVQEIEISQMVRYKYAICNDELFFNNSCLISMKLLYCEFSPPNGAIRWDKLKCLCIDGWTLDGDLIGKILSGSPCLETLELNNCYHFGGGIPISLFRNFGVLEHLSCDLKTYERLISCNYELLGDESEIDDELFREKKFISMKLLRCVFNPPNRAIRWDKLKFLCIDKAELNECSIGKILARSPCLETFQLNDCCGFRRIDVTSKSIKSLVLSFNAYSQALFAYTIIINAPYILSLTIKGNMYSRILLENVSSLVKADLHYWVSVYFRDFEEEELFRGLLSRLGHVNEITLGAGA